MSKGEVKLHLLTNDTIPSLKDPINTTRKLLGLSVMQQYTKLTQKQVAFLYTNNKPAQKDNKKISFTIAYKYTQN